ncbi:NF038129 family PEP-CTERM protein [Iodobacter ciconiae]|uniref:PEP-CTERM sorting domain-containing protein n=1 Tax=Iodobacter ciconiae TaxID=2496266 RepID=A0A3S8ZVI1_9NEIS|nr:NF038129 family PEP-CTERM protein [Iodobacter ciconiae]AZN37481.1 PEP-CTERM sorting domain-containing protein [Iodobacter ciconiae]
MKHTLKLALAGLFLACSSLASAAMYHVNVDTRTLDGQGGFVAFGLNGLSDSPLLSALVSQYRGSSLESIDIDNTFNVSGHLSSVLKLENRELNQFTQGVIFGKQLQFDVEFAGEQSLIGSGTRFALALYDRSFAALLSNDPTGAAVLAEFTSGQAVDFKTITDAQGNIMATITPVPEPETYALVGLGLLGLVMRRRMMGADLYGKTV